jgi:hypothetical protein
MKVRWCTFLFFASVVFILQGCSSRPVYDSLREIERQHCYQFEDPTERQKCLEEVDGVSYDEYQRIRENQQIQPMEDD